MTLENRSTWHQGGARVCYCFKQQGWLDIDLLGNQLFMMQNNCNQTPVRCNVQIKVKDDLKRARTSNMDTAGERKETSAGKKPISNSFSGSIFFIYTPYMQQSRVFWGSDIGLSLLSDQGDAVFFSLPAPGAVSMFLHVFVCSENDVVWFCPCTQEC